MNKKIEYEPVPIYNRKLLRGIMKARTIKNNGYHNVSGVMHTMFEKIKEARK